MKVASIAMVQQDLEVASSAPCPLPISAQLADIARLEEGWLNGDGPAYSQAAISRARAVFDALMEFGGIAMPYLYPSPEGAFRAEWNHPDRDIVVTLDATATRFSLLAVEVGGGVPTRRETFHSDADGLKMLSAALEKLLNADDP